MSLQNKFVKYLKLKTNIIIGINYSFKKKKLKNLQSTSISNKKIKKYSFIKIENLSKSLLKLKNEKKTIAIVPAFNEEATIGYVVKNYVNMFIK